MFDHSKLKGRIRELGMTQEKLAEEAEMSTVALNEKLNGKRSFRQEEIARICIILRIPPTEISAYFFTLKVQEIEP